MQEPTLKEKIKYNPKPASERLKKAIELMVAKGRIVSKAKILREAGYSESVARHPDKVFNQPAIRVLLEETDLDVKKSLNQLSHKVKAKHLDKMIFPALNPEKIGIEQLSDDDIRELIEDAGCTIRKIVHGEQNRCVYFWVDDDKTQLGAIEKVINLYGLYPSRKSETKAEISHFSLSDLRKYEEVK